MQRVKKLSMMLLTTALLSTASVSAHAYDRVVAMSSDVADVIVALGGAKKVVGKNAVYRNPALRHAKSVGMHRNLTVEAVLSVNPDLALGSYMVQPQSVYKRLNKFKVKAVNVAPKEDVRTFGNSIKKIGWLIGKSRQGQRLSYQWQKGMRPRSKTKTRYLLSYDGRHVAGRGTVGDTLIKLAGGINAGSGVKGLKPLSREAWLKAKPDVIIVAKHNLRVIGSKKKFVSRPEIRVSPAGKTNNVHFWSAGDYLRYGINSPQVVTKLHRLAKNKNRRKK